MGGTKVVAPFIPIKKITGRITKSWTNYCLIHFFAFHSFLYIGNGCLIFCNNPIRLHWVGSLLPIHSSIFCFNVFVLSKDRQKLPHFPILGVLWHVDKSWHLWKSSDCLLSGLTSGQGRKQLGWVPGVPKYFKGINEAVYMEPPSQHGIWQKVSAQ